MLDIVGLPPGLGEPVDGINTAISLRQEQYLDAGLSAASMVPVVGAIPGASKALRRISAIIRLADTLPAGIRGVLVDLLGGLRDELASLASRKMSDIVSGLKRRINEATERLRLAVKKKDDASLPGKTGKNKVSSTSSQTAPAEPPPPEQPPKKRRDDDSRSETSNADQKNHKQELVINPLTNNKEIANEPVENDHIYPRALIDKIEGMTRLSKDKKKLVYNNIYNLQRLLKSFNASKGKKTDWRTYKGNPLSPAFIVRLKRAQKKALEALVKQIEDLLKGDS